MAPAPHTAALLVVGNEILGAKVRDENGPWALERLRALGLETRRVEVVPDEVDVIADAVRRCLDAAALLVTSGGVGPTHDDVTVEAVAKALGVPVVRDPELEVLVRGFFGGRVNEARLRMADVPAGAQLLRGDANQLKYPAILARNVLVLPGVPALFREKLEAVCERWRAPAIALASLYLAWGETRIAADLTEAARLFPAVSVGSYPRFDDADHKVRVTVESRDGTAVAACVAWLRERLAGGVLREG